MPISKYKFQLCQKVQEVKMFKYLKLKYFKSFVNTGEPLVVTQNNNALVVILPAEKYIEFLEDDRLIAWFGKNLMIKHRKAFPIPLGIQDRERFNKVKMFNIEELPLFEKVGLHPVLFGELLAGRYMPALTYMLWFKDMDEREANWNKFRISDEWNTMRVKQEYANAVSKVRKKFLVPADYSQI